MKIIFCLCSYPVWASLASEYELNSKSILGSRTHDHVNVISSRYSKVNLDCYGGDKLSHLQYLTKLFIKWKYYPNSLFLFFIYYDCVESKTKGIQYQILIVDED